MSEYNAQNCVKIAGRYRNSKRRYLLVNPCQGKHIPVSPTKALDMMGQLGAKVKNKCKTARLVIGFAETATAIGAKVAEMLGSDCVYLTTTRERYESGEWLEFAEEHSHAPKQFINRQAAENALVATDTVVLVDDEFSTGRTLLNILNGLRRTSPLWNGKKFVAASVINRLSEENESNWSKNGIEAVQLIKLPPQDYAPQDNLSAPLCWRDVATNAARFDSLSLMTNLPDPRWGTTGKSYFTACQNLALEVGTALEGALANAERILVLGTEEFMYPPLTVGSIWEKRFGNQKQIFCHATTRSPIAIGDFPGYPVRSGYMLPGMYDENRPTYLYNLSAYDLAVVLTDSHLAPKVSRQALAEILAAHGTKQIVFAVGAAPHGFPNMPCF